MEEEGEEDAVRGGHHVAKRARKNKSVVAVFDDAARTSLRHFFLFYLHQSTPLPPFSRTRVCCGMPLFLGRVQVVKYGGRFWETQAHARG
jgi:hypothetical protein